MQHYEISDVLLAVGLSLGLIWIFWRLDSEYRKNK